MNTYLVLSFLNPTILWALALLAIPVIIHLFNFRRVKKVEFSNIALLKRVKEESSAKRKPVEILILISRLLFLAFLIFAFAQPIDKKDDNALELNKTVLVYVDNSLSMSKPAGSQQSALDLAFSFADNVIDNYPEDAKFKLLENGYSNSLGISYSKSTIKDRLTELEISPVSRDIDEIHRRIISSDFRGDVYLISDFQGDPGYDFQRFTTDTLRNFYFLPVELQTFSNVHFDTAYLENTFLLDGLKNVLKIDVKNEGRENLDQVNLKLYLGDQLSGTANLDIEANGLIQKEFEIDRQSEGLSDVRIEVEDNPVFFDNNLFLTLNNIEKLDVLEIRESGSNNYITQLFSDNELFNLESVNAGNLDLNKVKNADLIVVNELSALSNQLSSALNTHLDGDGSVVVIPNSSNNSGVYSNLGMRLSNDSRERVELNTPDQQNPFFDGVFEERETNIAMPTATASLRLRNTGTTFLNFKNGRPFLSKVDRVGNLYFFSCSFDANQTSFPSHSVFVPVMYKLALGSNVNLNTLYYSTDAETIEYPLPTDFAGNNIVSLSNGDLIITPDQRISGNKLVMVIPKDQIKEGHYKILVDDQILGTIAFNNPKSESNFGVISKESIRIAAQTADNIYLIDAESGLGVSQELTAGIKGVSLWKYAILLCLVFLFVEIILIRYL